MASSNGSLEERTAIALRRLHVAPQHSVLVAVSGGVDSMTMLSVLVTLRTSEVLRAVHAIHINHCLRGEASEADERLVRKMCESLAVPVEVRRTDTAAYAREKKLGLEEAARDLRYSAFTEVAERLGIDFVITAHTANDQAETVLMNMIRGAGLRGLSGIPERRSLGSATLVRPWLSVQRQEIQGYASTHGVVYSEDATNAELVFQRNRVRHTVVPALAQAFPDRDVVSAIARLAGRMTSTADLIESIARRELEAARRSASLDLASLRALPSEIAIEAIELWLDQELGRYRLSADRRERVADFLSLDSGRLELPGVILESNRGRLSIEDHAAEFDAVALGSIRELQLPQGRMCLRDAARIQLDAGHLYLAAARVEGVTVRPWQPGERMTPFGMPGQTKLISDLLTDAGMTGSRRRNYPVLASREEVLWIPGVRASESTRIDKHAEDLLGSLIEVEWLPDDEQ